MLLTGIRIVRRGNKNPLPMPLMIYGPAMKFYFEWIASEVSEKGNQEAADRLYYLARLAVFTLQGAISKRPELFRPIARCQLDWPSMIGRNADFDRMNKQMMEYLNLGEMAPLNTARNGRKSFSIIENTETQIAFNLWATIEFFRREEQEISSFDPVCSFVMPDLPNIYDVRKLGLTDEHIKKLKSLQPLSRQNYVEWWKIAEPAFVHRYGKDFENHESFSRYRKSSAYKDDPKPAGKIKSAIKKQIKLAFRSIAPKSSAVE
jgi:hypothetical protein